MADPDRRLDHAVVIEAVPDDGDGDGWSQPDLPMEDSTT